MFITHLPPQPIPLGVTLSVVLAASTDLTVRRVPNLLIAFGLIASLAVRIWLSGPLGGLAHWSLGVLTGFAVLFPLYLLGGTAAGDVKLLMLVGAWIGPEATFSVALMAFIVGGCWAFALVLLRGHLVRLFTNVAWLMGSVIRGGQMLRGAGHIPAGSVGTIPFAASIAAGTLIVLCGST